MSWLFSRALVEAYSEATCLDGEPCAPSSGTPTPQAYSSHGKMTDFSRLSRFGMTCSPLTDDHGEAVLTWCLEASLARTSASQAKALESTVNANKAALEQAQLQLSYAQIQAPISGRTGSLSVRAGNLVTGGTGGAPLVVINSTQPILVSLGVPQRYLDEVRKYWGTADLRVDISPNPGAPAVATGQLVFIDNTVNPTTGTITLKARVKNDKEELWPGQFIAARIVLRVEKDALVLPEQAVLPGQNGTFVYVVRDGRAKVQRVTVDRQLGERMVISGGLSGDEEVVTNVPPSVTDGSQIVVRGAEKAGEGGDAKEGKKGGGRKGDKDKNPPAKDEASKEAKS